MTSGHATLVPETLICEMEKTAPSCSWKLRKMIESDSVQRKQPGSQKQDIPEPCKQHATALVSDILSGGRPIVKRGELE